jgi:DNA topoisomerase-1
MKVYLEGKDESEAEVGLLPALTEGGNVTLLGAKASQRFTRPKGRYTEASLVKALEEKGIGRPSTYAPTITTIQKRAYVQKGTLDGKVRDVTIGSFEGGSWSWEVIQEKFGANKGRLVPTDIGNVVTDFLLSHFDTVMDYAFTANIEQEFDLVASGQVSWTEVIDSFYQPFIKTVGITKDVDPEKGERSLGEQPKTGKKVIARLARYGPVVQVGETTETEKAKFVSIPAELSIETITLDEALELLKMPRVLGSHEGVDIKANLGRFGPYVQMSKTFASIPEEQSPYTINLTEAMVLIEAKLEADRKANIATLDGDKGEIRVLNGRYGPYLKFEKKNVTIPKDVEPESLTYEAALALIEEAASKPKRGRKGKAKK